MIQLKKYMTKYLIDLNNSIEYTISLNSLKQMLLRGEPLSNTLNADLDSSKEKFKFEGIFSKFKGLPQEQ